MAIIEVKNLYKEYKQGSKVIKAVDGVNLKIEKGEFLVIVGPSGCGKTTFLQLLGGLEFPTSGEVLIDGVNIAKMKESKLAKIRRDKIGFIFQNFNLLPTLTAGQNVEAVIAYQHTNRQKRVTEMLERVGIATRANHLPGLLSGGEQQRVAIARALINEPDIILADEPTGNLDSKTGEEILSLLRELNKKFQQTIVLATHSEYAQKFADRVIKMKDGKIISS
jgi:putative ABC transport system ATP-binding protein